MTLNTYQLHDFKFKVTLLPLKNETAFDYGITVINQIPPDLYLF